MDPVYTTLLDAMGTLFLAETGRIAGQRIRKLLLLMNRIDKFTDHRMLGSTDQIEILSLDLVHHGIHFLKTHDTRHHIAADHKRRYTVGKATVNHEISRIRDHCRMKSGDITHQIIEAIACYLACRIQINSVKTAHNVGVIGNLKIRNNRLTKLLDLHIVGIIRSDGNRRIDDIRDHHHIGKHFFGVGLFLLLKLCQTCSKLCHLCLNLLCLFLFALLHESTDLL